MKLDQQTLDNIFKRAHYLTNQMIFQANHRTDKEKGDPKVGGHSSASSSSLHLLGTLHLLIKSGFDHIANKPHASPVDHAFNYLLDLFLKEDFSRLSPEESHKAMMGLRAFSKNGEPVFQSYHSVWDPDHHNFFPSGTVGIPPVKAGYLALAYNYARKHGYTVPDAHFWCIIGDSEFREGSLFEAVPDFAERQIGNLTWIIDYNRQSLDGHRITNTQAMKGTDAFRIEQTMVANGWEVIQVQHGQKRQDLFKAPQGQTFQRWLEKDLSDYDLQTLLLLKDPQEIKKQLLKIQSISGFIQTQSPEDLKEALQDMGGHHVESLIAAYEASKISKDRPTLIIAHTIKGWGLEMAAQSGNHSALPSAQEMDELRVSQEIPKSSLFERFSDSTSEQHFLKRRGESLYKEILKQEEIRKKNLETLNKTLSPLPDTLNINLKLASYPHTQWMLGQLTSKLTRIANTNSESQKALTENEKLWKTASELLVSMAPDVGTSTNLNPSMDGKVFSANDVEDIETERGVKDKKTPDLVPGEENSDRFLRFEIAEANVMSCAGSFGRMRDLLGIPLYPLMTIYDFFIKRALDQYFYNMYWNSSFFLGGTPSGVTLSPEGAQHGWKSDFQVPNQIIWEPFFCQELDWIFCDSLKRHFENNNAHRGGVVFRGVTRGVNQKDFITHLKAQKRFKSNSRPKLSPKGFNIPEAVDESEVSSMEDSLIFNTVKNEVLKGAYKLIDYEGYAEYVPGDNVVHIFAMGALGTEAIQASKALLQKGIYGNVIVVTCPDLLIGNLAQQNNYEYLKENLNINSDLYLFETSFPPNSIRTLPANEHPSSHPSSSQKHPSSQKRAGKRESFLQNDQSLENSPSFSLPEAHTFSGRRIPIVSVHDGEPGLLDNIGSIIGVPQESLAVRKHSKCGTPKDIYKYHSIDSEAIVKACGKALSETALEQIQIYMKDPATGALKLNLETPPQIKPHQVDWSHLWAE